VTENPNGRETSYQQGGANETARNKVHQPIMPDFATGRQPANAEQSCLRSGEIGRRLKGMMTQALLARIVLDGRADEPDLHVPASPGWLEFVR
jgi:hypothetical protein